MSDSHLTAPTRFVEADGDKFALRRWGNTSGGQPPLGEAVAHLLFLLDQQRHSKRT